MIGFGIDSLYISFGHPDGTFGAPRAYLVAQNILDAAFADFNGDGVVDLAVTGDSSIEISLGNGDGTVAPYVPLTVANASFASSPLAGSAGTIVHGDFNGDGKQDLLATGSTVPARTAVMQNYMFAGKGDGTFLPPVVTTTRSLYIPNLAVSALDANHDGLDDLVQIYGVSAFPPFSVSINLSKGDGTFGPAILTNLPVELSQSSSTAYTPTPPAFADFNGDGKLDLAIAEHSNLYIFPGQGDGTFSSNPSAFALPFPNTALNGNAYSIATGDFDGDGNQDSAVFYESPDSPAGASLYVFYGDGKGSFSDPITVVPPGLLGTLITPIADVNKDGFPDLVVRVDNAVQVLHGHGDRTLSIGPSYIVNAGSVFGTTADFNRDGLTDILATGGNAVTVLLNKTPSASGSLTISPEPSSYGQPIALSATLNPDPLYPALGGAVAFSIDGISVGSAAVSSNSASFTGPATLGVGTHRVTALWSGDSTYSQLSLSSSHTIIAAPTTSTLQVQPGIAGAPATLTATVTSPNSLAPVGSVTFTDGTTVLGLVTLTNVSAGLSTASYSASSGSAPGTHVFTAAYMPGDGFAASTGTATLTVAAKPNVTISSMPANPVAGQAVTLAVNVAGASGSNTPTGTVIVTEGSISLGSVKLDAAGHASLVTSALLPGTHSITASYSGDTLFSPGTAVASLAVLALSTTTLAVTPSGSTSGQSVTLTASVTGSSGTPGGTVAFLDGTAQLGSATLDANGHAVYTTSSLAPGSHGLSAGYAGNATYGSSTSSAVSATVQAPSPDLSLSFGLPTLNVTSGTSAVQTLTVSSLNGLADTLNLSCSGLPTYATCLFSPASVSLAAGGTATSALTVEAYTRATAHLRPAALGRTPANGTFLALLISPLALAATRRRHLVNRLLLLTTLTAATGAVVGCSSASPQSTPALSPPGAYTVSVIATSKATGISRTSTFTLIVMQ